MNVDRVKSGLTQSAVLLILGLGGVLLGSRRCAGPDLSRGPSGPPRVAERQVRRLAPEGETGRDGVGPPLHEVAYVHVSRGGRLPNERPVAHTVDIFQHPVLRDVEPQAYDGDEVCPTDEDAALDLLASMLRNASGLRDEDWTRVQQCAEYWADVGSLWEAFALVEFAAVQDYRSPVRDEEAALSLGLALLKNRDPVAASVAATGIALMDGDLAVLTGEDRALLQAAMDSPKLRFPRMFMAWFLASEAYANGDLGAADSWLVEAEARAAENCGVGRGGCDFELQYSAARSLTRSAEEPSWLGRFRRHATSCAVTHQPHLTTFECTDGGQWSPKGGFSGCLDSFDEPNTEFHHIEIRVLP